MSHRILLASSKAESNHFGQLGLEHLQKMHHQIQRNIIPLGVNQDPRLAPSGRIIDSEIIEEEPGHFILIGETEFFNVPLESLRQVENKELLVRVYTHPIIIYDSNMKSRINEEWLYNLKVLLKAEMEHDQRLSKDQLSVLTLAFNGVLGNVSKSFLSSYEKATIKEIVALLGLIILRKSNEEEILLCVQHSIKHGNLFINVDINLTNPEPSDIEKLFRKSLKKFDSILVKHYQPGKNIRKMVYDYSKGNFSLQYVLLKNGIPMFPKLKS